MFISPFINQHLCTIPCILNHISVTAPTRCGVYCYDHQEAPSNRKFFATHQMIISTC